MKNNIFFEESVDPYDDIKKGFIIKAEHLGRYFFGKKLTTDKKIKTIYDLGCGNGYGSIILSHKNKKVFGFDIATTGKALNSDFVTIDLNNDSLSKLVLEKNIPKPDFIICFETLEHVDNPAKLLNEIHTVLQPEGKLLLSVPNAQFEPKKNGKSKNIFHKNLFYEKDIEQLVLDAGFRIKGIYGQPLANFILHKIRWLIPFFDALLLSNKTVLDSASNFIGGPIKNKVSFSYSIIICAEC